MTPPTSGPNSAKPTTGEVVAGVYNANPPTLVDGQACPIQVDINGQIKTSGGGATADVNIADVAGNPPALINPLPVELSDGTPGARGPAGNISAAVEQATQAAVAAVMQILKDKNLI